MCIYYWLKNQSAYWHVTCQKPPRDIEGPSQGKDFYSRANKLQLNITATNQATQKHNIADYSRVCKCRIPVWLSYTFATLVHRAPLVSISEVTQCWQLQVSKWQRWRERRGEGRNYYTLSFRLQRRFGDCHENKQTKKHLFAFKHFLSIWNRKWGRDSIISARFLFKQPVLLYKAKLKENRFRGKKSSELRKLLTSFCYLIISYPSRLLLFPLSVTDKWLFMQ